MSRWDLYKEPQGPSKQDLIDRIAELNDQIAELIEERDQKVEELEDMEVMA